MALPDTMMEHDMTPRGAPRQFKKGKRAGRMVSPPKGRATKRGRRKSGRA